MATSLTLENDSSLAQGYIKVNGTTAATLTTSGITGNLTGNVTGSLTAGGSLTLATAQTASGTAVDFTSIPSWVKRITVMFRGVSTNGSSNPTPRVQIGSGSIDSSGYLGSATHIGTAVGASNFTNGFDFIDGSASPTAAYTRHGSLFLTLLGSNVWAANGMISLSDSARLYLLAGSKTLSSVLDQIRITTANGTDTFDAGTINIMFEG